MKKTAILHLSMLESHTHTIKIYLILVVVGWNTLSIEQTHDVAYGVAKKHGHIHRVVRACVCSCHSTMLCVYLGDVRRRREDPFFIFFVRWSSLLYQHAKPPLDQLDPIKLLQAMGKCYVFPPLISHWNLYSTAPRWPRGADLPAVSCISVHERPSLGGLLNILYFLVDEAMP